MHMHIRVLSTDDVHIRGMTYDASRFLNRGDNFLPMAHARYHDRTWTSLILLCRHISDLLPGERHKC